MKKSFKLILVMILSLSLMLNYAFADEDSDDVLTGEFIDPAVLEMLRGQTGYHTYSPIALGIKTSNFNDGLGDDSWTKIKEFKVTISGSIFSSFVNVGFKDRTFHNYDTLKIPSANGMATGVQGFITLTNDNGTEDSDPVTNGHASDTLELEHEYVALRYTLTIEV